MHHPGLEPGSAAWEATIIPLDQWCVRENCSREALKIKSISERVEGFSSERVDEIYEI